MADEGGSDGVTEGVTTSSPWRGRIILVTAMAASALVATLIATAGDDSDAEGDAPSVTQPPTTDAQETLDDRPETTPTVPIETIPIDETLGVYPGFGDEASLLQLEDTLGTRLGAVVQFADQRSADQMVASVQGALTSLREWITDREPTYSLTIPLAFGDDDARSDEGKARVSRNLAETASGAHDEQYRVVAERLLSRGVTDAVLRIGHEFDGNWFPWSAQASCEDYAEAFRHVASLFRQESAAFRIEWTGTLRNFDSYGSCAYPGDDFVDIFGLDVYDRGGPLDRADADGWIDPPAVWEEQFRPLLESHLAFAVERGKPVSYPEWGIYLATNGGPAGGDNPYFVNAMADWFESLPESGGGSLLYQAYFIGVTDYDIRTAPNSWQVFLERFGAS